LDRAEGGDWFVEWIGLAGLDVDKEAFLRSHGRETRTLSRNYSRLLKNPGEDEIHDARTATRRAEALIELMPRHHRKSSDLDERYHKVMEKTAAVRDMDVLLTKLSGPEGSRRLVRAAEKTRRKAVGAVREAVTSAGAVALPSLSHEDVRSARLQRRFEKVAGRLAEDVERRLPRVIADPSDAKDLHKLRIDIKKLRYLVGAVAPANPSPASRLESMQDALGSIHDWDVCIAYVSKLDPAWDVLPAWEAEREREFRGFAREYGGRHPGSKR